MTSHACVISFLGACTRRHGNWPTGVGLGFTHGASARVDFLIVFVLSLFSWAQHGQAWDQPFDIVQERRQVGLQHPCSVRWCRVRIRKLLYRGLENEPKIFWHGRVICIPAPGESGHG